MFDGEVKKACRDTDDQRIVGQTDEVKLGEPGWRERYYATKLEGTPSQKVAEHYVEGLCWVMRYYYQGCPAWGWHFPYHYAPFAADLIDIAVWSHFSTHVGSFVQGFRVDFDPGSPFKPFNQLMAVLPAASADALPTAYRRLMRFGQTMPDLELMTEQRARITNLGLLPHRV